MRNSGRAQSIEMRVTMAGEQVIAITNRHPRTASSSVEVQIGDLALHVHDHPTMAALVTWTNELVALRGRLPPRITTVAPAPPVTAPAFAVRLDANVITLGLVGVADVADLLVVRGTIGTLTVDLRDQRALASVAAAIGGARVAAQRAFPDRLPRNSLERSDPALRPAMNAAPPRHSRLRR